jgi:cell division protein FtsN
MLNQDGSAKTDTLVKLVLIFFISLLSFSVGTFVGKQFSDSQYKMAQLEGDAGSDQREPSSLDPAALEASPPDALTEEDIASLEEEFAKGKTVDTEKSDSKTSDHSPKADKKVAMNDNHGSKMEDHKEVGKKVGHMVDKATHNATEINAEAKNVKANKPKKVDEKIAEIANKVMKGETPVTHKVEQERAPSSLPKTVANDVVGKFTVQVSAYTKEPDAVEHTKALKDKGFSAFYIPASVNGTTWFRVNVGLYSTSKEAQDYMKKIVGADIKSAIVKKIVQN